MRKLSMQKIGIVLISIVLWGLGLIIMILALSPLYITYIKLFG
jgi:hypothetical protein